MSGHRPIVTACMPKPESLTNGETFWPLRAGTSHCTYADLYAKAIAKSCLDYDTQTFLDKIAPQEGDDSTMTSQVSIFECLVRNLHCDLHTVRAIAQLEKHHFKHKQ